jgi:hypothetical protein
MACEVIAVVACGFALTACSSRVDAELQAASVPGFGGGGGGAGVASLAVESDRQAPGRRRRGAA